MNVFLMTVNGTYFVTQCSMKLQDQVTSLELSKKLKELGVKQDSLFYWTNEWGADSVSILKTMNVRHQPNLPAFEEEYKEVGDFQFFSAFTVAELGELLPREHSYSWKLENGWCVGANRWEESLWKTAQTEADARAKTLIYFIENKLLQTDQG